MIHSEQCLARSSVKDHFTEASFHMITSGVLNTDRQTYLRDTDKWGWRLQTEIIEGEWACYHFKASST